METVSFKKPPDGRHPMKVGRAPMKASVLSSTCLSTLPVLDVILQVDISLFSQRFNVSTTHHVTLRI